MVPASAYINQNNMVPDSSCIILKNIEKASSFMNQDK